MAGLRRIESIAPSCLILTICTASSTWLASLSPLMLPTASVMMLLRSVTKRSLLLLHSPAQDSWQCRLHLPSVLSRLLQLLRRSFVFSCYCLAGLFCCCCVAGFPCCCSLRWLFLPVSGQGPQAQHTECARHSMIPYATVPQSTTRYR